MKKKNRRRVNVLVGLPHKYTQNPRNKGKRRSQDEGEDDRKNCPFRSDFPPQNSNGCKTRYVEDHEYREDQYLSLGHYRENLGRSQGLNQHDHGELLSEDAEDEGRPHPLRKPQEGGKWPKHGIGETV